MTRCKRRAKGVIAGVRNDANQAKPASLQAELCGYDERGLQSAEPKLKQRHHGSHLRPARSR